MTAMTVVVILACLWVLAATVVALLPMRRQYAPGLALLLAAPVLIVALGLTVNWLAATAATLGFLSMFRHPLRYLARRALGLPTPPPPTDPSDAPDRQDSP